VFRGRIVKTHGQLMREELNDSFEHMRMAAAHAAGGAAGAIAPRLEAARGRVEPKLSRSKEWIHDTASKETRQAKRVANQVVSKAKGKTGKKGTSMTKRWPAIIGGLMAAGIAAGAAGAVLSRRRQRKWNEYGSSPSISGTGQESRSFVDTPRSTTEPVTGKPSTYGETAKDKAPETKSSTTEKSSMADLGSVGSRNSRL
jgi:hypothetical protein